MYLNLVLISWISHPWIFIMTLSTESIHKNITFTSSAKQCHMSILLWSFDLLPHTKYMDVFIHQKAREYLKNRKLWHPTKQKWYRILAEVDFSLWNLYKAFFLQSFLNIEVLYTSIHSNPPLCPVLPPSPPPHFLKAGERAPSAVSLLCFSGKLLRPLHKLVHALSARYWSQSIQDIQRHQRKFPQKSQFSTQ